MTAVLSAPAVRQRYGEAGLLALTQRMRQDAARLRSLSDVDGPLGLQLLLNPLWVETPALRLVSDEMERAISTPGSRLMISLPPQEGKSRLLRHAAVRALQHNPDTRIAVASYEVRLARRTGEAARNIISLNGSRAVDPTTGVQLPDRLGIAVQAGAAAGGDWSVDGREGGILSVGVGSGITGNNVDLLLVDDPIKGRAQADSEVIRSALHEWWDNDADSRLGPDSSVIIVMTRWHEDDLIGRLLSSAEVDDDAVELGVARDDQWRVVNVPAQADGVTLDSLADVPGGRTPEGWLLSARGDRTPKWRRLRDRRPRVFASLYQGRPAPLAGGIFESSWIEKHRVKLREFADVDLVSTAVAVDPADTGTGDAAGILVGSRAVDGDLYVRADLTGQLSQRQWARRTLLAAIRYSADTIVQENNLGMGRALRDEWSLVRRQAQVLRETGAALNGHAGDDAFHAAQAAALLVSRGDQAAADVDELLEVLPLVDDVLSRVSELPCGLKTVTPRQSKYVRAKGITGLYEAGRAHHVGHLKNLEHQMQVWQPGQASPNELDTLAHLLTHLDNAVLPTQVSRATPARSSSGGGRLPSRTATDPRRGGSRRR